MKTYRVWLELEEYDDNTDVYETVEQTDVETIGEVPSDIALERFFEIESKINEHSQYKEIIRGLLYCNCDVNPGDCCSHVLAAKEILDVKK